MADQVFDDFFGAGGDLFPSFTPDGNAPLNSSPTSEINIPAFNGYDGGEVAYPIVTTGNLIYSGEDLAPDWTYAPTAVYTGHTNFMGGRYDASDDLFWIATYDSGTDTLGLSTINAAGTIVNKGTTVLGSALGIGVITTLRRDVDGVGNFTVNGTNREIELNFTTGAVVTDTTFTGTGAGIPLAGAFRVQAGLYVEVWGAAGTAGGYSTTMRWKSSVPGGPVTRFMATTVDISTPEPNVKGLPSTNGTSTAPPWAIVESGVHVLIVHGTGALPTLEPNIWYKKDLFVSTLNKMARNYGII